MNFNDKLTASIEKNNSLVCVGLDSDIDKLPEHSKHQETPQFTFNKAIIDATHDLVCCYKPNPAFYEANGEQGIKELKLTCEYIKGIYPEIPIIIDAKRGDIGNTNEGYAKYVFDYLGGDAITVMPYMGIESLSCFFKREGKGIIVGCHSSNPGAKEFQEKLFFPERPEGVEGAGTKPKPLYEIVAEELVKQHGDNPNVMMFMGATFPEQLTDIRKIIGDMTFLVPGVGAQGGDVETFVKAGMNSQNAGLIINGSRAIIFASSGDDFADRAVQETKKLRDEINKYR
ncbi:MAG TPA: orotidine-5'-phosphate decarboxylase [Candidatus Saccharimonadales bacterium]|nr:orotidine-5'-phosphate decarboxylase [Candidatus Saccharimonadales bacterium]